MPYTLVATVLGGVLTLALLGLRICRCRRFWRARTGSSGCMTASAGIPYGVALAAGVFVVLPGTEIFRLAAAGE